MNTLFQVNNKGEGKLDLIYLTNYPEIIEGKVVWKNLKIVNVDDLFICKENLDGEWERIVVDIKAIPFTSELEKTMFEQQEWSQVKTLDGTEYLFPPEGIF